MKKFLSKLKQGINTTDYNSLGPEEYKQQTVSNWTEAPCGSSYSDSEPLTLDYFEEIEKHRYRTHPWIYEAIQAFDIQYKEVLEIGFGMGTDHLNMARRGGRMHGIDITPRNLEVTNSRFKLYGLETNLITGDAENLPYPAGSFDFVYSFGVIHHSPDTQKIIMEIHRLLKSGGKCYITVYHKNSIFFWWTVFLVKYVLKGGWKNRTLQQQISLIEYPNTNQDLVIKLYGRNEFHQMFSIFSDAKSYIKHLLPIDIAYISSLYSTKDNPARFLTKTGNMFGWYVVIEAVK